MWNSIGRHFFCPPNPNLLTAGGTLHKADDIETLARKIELAPERLRQLVGRAERLGRRQPRKGRGVRGRSRRDALLCEGQAPLAGIQHSAVLRSTCLPSYDQHPGRHRHRRTRSRAAKIWRNHLWPLCRGLNHRRHRGRPRSRLPWRPNQGPGLRASCCRASGRVALRPIVTHSCSGIGTWKEELLSAEHSPMILKLPELSANLDRGQTMAATNSEQVVRECALRHYQACREAQGRQCKLIERCRSR